MPTNTTTAPAGDADVARVAALIGEPARAKVLLALADGRALPASRLAAEAGVAASTISEHLARLVDANLLMAERSGRSRYFRLVDPSVARALEAIALIAPPEPIRSLRQGTRAHALREARTCYHHLAGRLGVAVMAALIEAGVLEGGDGTHYPDTAPADHLSGPGRDVTYRLTPAGHHKLADFGVDTDETARKQAPIRYCLDWSEQRHHLGGALGAAINNRLFDLDWIRHTPQPRALTLTDAGRAGLHDTFGVPQDWDHT